MDVTNIREAIKLEFDANGLPLKNEIDEAINECVRNINGRTPAINAIITITGTTDDDADTWNVDDIDINVDDIDVNVDDMGRFIGGFSFDTDTNCLTIPETIISLKRFFINDIEQIPKPYEKMINTYPPDEDYFYLLYGTRVTADAGYFTQYGNKVYFQKDLSAEESIIKLVVEKEYDELSGNTLELPEYCKQYLISNCIKILGSRTKNIISDRAYSRHLAESDRFFRVILNRQASIEQSKNLDIW